MPHRSTRLSTNVFIAGVAAGAATAAFQLDVVPRDVPVQPQDQVLLSTNLSGVDGVGGDNVGPNLLRVRQRPDHDEVERLNTSLRLTAQREAEAAARRKAEYEAEQARKIKVFAPTQGTITSNYGPRWGTTHYGLDIANRIGTPIRSVMDGVVVEAGPASGFGLWVKIEHTDGTTAVYGHIDSYSVREGQKVSAGQVIAQVGNRGISTGPHLHFEIWDQAGRKLDPLAWLQERGVQIA
ncbi:Peptidase family M23 [Lentzea waywayandensis]|uniref:Peptidase family M23 n=2 Tax=Lentzea waywayandensis TaxID=84724 RepID=A0A1I6F4U7_9PSEU|nr:Peptidase family M23 [Lentzea waywayandensis]